MLCSRFRRIKVWGYFLKTISDRLYLGLIPVNIFPDLLSKPKPFLHKGFVAFSFFPRPRLPLLIYTFLWKRGLSSLFSTLLGKRGLSQLMCLGGVYYA